MLNINIACGSILWKQIPHLVFKAIRGLKSTLAFVQILQSVNHLAFKNSVKAAAVKTTFITYSLWDINLCDIVHQADCLEISVLLLTCYDFTCYDGPWKESPPFVVVINFTSWEQSCKSAILPLSRRVVYMLQTYISLKMYRVTKQTGIVTWIM